MLLLFTLATTVACSQPVDVAKAVQADVVTTGWRPAKIAGAANKIVPSASVTLKNVSGQTLNAVQVNAVFRLVSTNEELGSDFHPVSQSGGFTAGAQTDIAFKADRGYTGTDREDDLLTNSHFVDAKVEVFVKAGAGQWTRVGERTVARQLIGS
jgi:hypothetical protein